MIIYRRGRCPGGRRLKSLDLQWVGRGCFLWRTLPHNFANVSFAIITLRDNGHTLTSTFNCKTEINQICFRMTWSPNIVLDWILWIFRQSWLGSSWASIVPPPTSSPSCSSCSTRATGPSTSSSCPTSSSTGYQSESPDAQIVSICLLVKTTTWLIIAWERCSEKRMNSNRCILQGRAVVIEQ